MGSTDVSFPRSLGAHDEGDCSDMRAAYQEDDALSIGGVVFADQIEITSRG